MTALAAAGQRLYFMEDNAVYWDYEVEAGETIWQGGLVAIDSDGYASAAADTSGWKVVGWADESVANTGADGAIKVRVKSGCIGRMAASSIAQTSMDAGLLYVVDDNTVDETTPANSVKAGILVRVNSSTSCDMYIPPFGVFTYGL